MRIGLTGGASTVDAIVDQAKEAEQQGFSALWYASSVARDPVTAMAIAGRETTRIELGTAVLQTYPCHPLLQANRAMAAAEAMGRPGFTLGIGPSHEPLIRDVYGLSYAHPGRHTEEYLQIISAILRGETIHLDGADWTAHLPGVGPRPEVPLLLSALSPRMLRIAGQYADGTICWMASTAAIESHVAPRIRSAAEQAGRPAPRIVAGLPVAVHPNAHTAREAIDRASHRYAGMTNYRRIIETGGGRTPADVSIVGDEKSVEEQLRRLIDAGATDIWAQPVPVGDDPAQRKASRDRTVALLSALARD